MKTRREPLTRESIVRTAVEYADAHGVAALTMRRLGEVLGVEAMSIYPYVNGREDLLEGMVASIVAGVHIPTEDVLGVTDGWQAFLQHTAHEVRGVAVQHPNLFPLVATRPPAAPWLRPPLRSLEIVEQFLDGLIHRGLEERHAVQVYKVFTSFLLGHLLLEVSVRGADTGPPEEPLDEGDADVPNADQDHDLAEYPTVERLREPLSTHDLDVEFEQALE